MTISRAMFFDGHLQDGIALALEQRKVVVCFVTGLNNQSKLWEEYLKDDQIIDQLEASAVVLRIEDGSQEAVYLTAFYPISALPALVVINNGQQIAEIRGDLLLDSFKQRLLSALKGESSQGAVACRFSATNIEVSDPGTQATPTFESGEDHRPVDPTIQTLRDERTQQLEIDHRRKKAAEWSERRVKQEIRRPEAEAATRNSAQAKQASYAEQQRKKQQEVRQERERILQVIESDKLERKHEEESRKALVESATSIGNRKEGLLSQHLSTDIIQLRPGKPSACALQIRLFDGSTIRSCFAPDHSIRGNVRKWIDQQRSDRDLPYIFRQVLNPKLNHTISISEEEETLQSLGLTPNATLIMVPVRRYTAAYAEDGGYLSKGLAATFNLISGGFSWVNGAMRTFLGTVLAVVNPPQRHANTKAHTIDIPVAPTSGTNIRTLRDQQKKEESKQYYNGNQLNFEPRKDNYSKDD